MTEEPFLPSNDNSHEHRFRSLGWASLLVASFLLSVFAVLAIEVVKGNTNAFDRAVLLSLRSTSNPSNPMGPAWLVEMGRDVTALGSFAFLAFVSAAVVGYLLIAKRRGYALLVAIAVIGGETISTILKNVFDRPRPEIPHAARVFTASFPSGHAMLSAITFLTLGSLMSHATDDIRLKRYYLSIAVFLTVAVGLSRLYLGVHYPTDVLAGWCVGGAWALLCWTGVQWLNVTSDIKDPVR